MADRLKLPLFDAKPPKDRREEATATAVSLLFHAVLLMLVLVLGGRAALTVAADLGVGDGWGIGPAGGGGGGGNDQAIAITPTEEPAAAAVEAEEPVEPVPEPIPVPEPEIKPVEPPVALASPPDTVSRRGAATQGSGSGQGAGTGTGTGAGTGPGSGSGSGGGSGGGVGSGVGPGSGAGRLLAPSPEVLLIPPPAPGSVRGKTVVVRLEVDSAGVVRDVELIPSTGDRKYDSALKKVAMGWRFRSARDPFNRPIAVSFDVTFTF